MSQHRSEERRPRKRMLILLKNPKYPNIIFIQVRSCFMSYKIYDTMTKIWNKYRISNNQDYYYNFYELYDGSLLKFKREYLEIDENVDDLGETYHEIVHKYRRKLREEGYTQIYTIKKSKNIIL